ncbi:hypothetical protein JXA32_16825 [Candidatus Sumerlaeota bacterium]|nr:hypothetical protein [Candidatus Sumerlaeota bacterium]
MPLVQFQQPAGSFSGRLGSGTDSLVYYMLDGRGVARQFTLPTQPNSTDQ